MSQYKSMCGMYIILNRDGDNFWQGRIENQVSPDHYLVQIFSALTGDPTMAIIESIQGMAKSESEIYPDRDSFLEGYRKRMARINAASASSDKNNAEKIYEWLSSKIHISDPSWRSFHRDDLGKNGPVRKAADRDRALKILIEERKLESLDGKTFSFVQ